MAVNQTSATLNWCRKEVGPITEGLKILIGSQLGYEGRKVAHDCSRKCLQVAVCGGNVVDPLKPSPSGLNSSPFQVPSFSLPSSVIDVGERANVVAVGIRTFAELLSQGIYPGSGGYIVNEKGEKVYSSGIGLTPNAEFVASLYKLADGVAKGLVALPISPLPNFVKLAALATETLKSIDFPALSGASTTSSGLGSNGRLFEHSSTMPSEVASTVTSTATTPQFPAEGVNPITGLTKDEEEFLINAARSVNDHAAAESLLATKAAGQPEIYRPELPKNYKVESLESEQNMSASKERRVPASRIGRLASFGQLGVGLVGGAAAEVTRRTLGMGVSAIGSAQNPFLSKANADRIVETLCRVRGAALKLGQMLSIQDSETVPASLLEVFERVRHSADFMPLRQVNKQMTGAFGHDWRDKFESFEEKPFAAASIGQVHKATLKDGRVVAVKIQYPGVSEGIDSDINNLVSVLSIGGIFPKGMFLNEFVKVARRELRQECDYNREARAIRVFRKLLKDSKDYYIPEVIDELSSERVLTTEFVVGKPVDKCIDEPQVVRDYIAGKFIELCLKEIFEWRFMQTDPNWSNFYLGVHPVTGEPRLVLLDFGASRAYGKQFVDKYMRIIKGAYDGDDEEILKFSREIGFLTGYETSVMEKAHIESVRIMGETLASDHPYDFSQQNVTKRIHKLVPVMLEHRLTSPPEEIYSLHRKLSGSYLLATKLKATVSCGGLFSDIHRRYKYGEDDKDICID